MQIALTDRDTKMQPRMHTDWEVNTQTKTHKGLSKYNNNNNKSLSEYNNNNTSSESHRP